jgi:NAD(P)H-dependent FMN reductase
MKTILAIIGSASQNSSNQKLVEYLASLAGNQLTFKLYTGLKSLPHFDPELSVNNTPQEILDFRKEIELADGVIICTPEYVFSIPSGLKNAIEWCVSATVFSEKPCGLITASAQGEKGHEELQLLMKTLMAYFTPGTALLIPGIKGKINASGEVTHPETKSDLEQFLNSFRSLLK